MSPARTVGSGGPWRSRLARGRVHLSLLAAVLLAAGPSAAQAGDGHGTGAAAVGHPFLSPYPAADYGAGARIWSVAQDGRGVLYVANGLGVLEYDGAGWRFLPLPNESYARVVARDARGRIWVGGVGEVGYLAPDARGRTRFVSVVDRIPPAARPVADVWTIHDTPDGTYFNTRTHLFRWRNGTVRVWAAPTESPFGFIFPVRGGLYVHEHGAGLFRLEGDALVPVPGGERFADARVTVMLPFGTDEGGVPLTLVGAGSDLFLYDGRAFVPFRTEAAPLLRAHAIYRPGAVLPGGDVALGLIGGGAVVVDRQGRLVRHVDRAAGLADNSVLYTFADRDGALWLAHNRGLARVDVAAPLTRFAAGAGAPDGLITVVRHGGRLYAGTEDGALVLDEAVGVLRPVTGLSGQVFALASAGDALLAWTSADGLRRIEGTRSVPQRVDDPPPLSPTAMVRSRRDPALLFLAFADGAGVLERTGRDRWSLRRIPGTDGSYRIAEDARGALWIGSVRRGVQRVRFPAGPGRAAEVDVFDVPDRLAAGVYVVRGEVYAATPRALYRFDEERGTFVRDRTFDGVEMAAPSLMQAMVDDAEGRVWASFGRGVAVRLGDDEGGRAETGPFRPFARSGARAILPEAGGITWFATEDGLVRYDGRVATRTASPVSTLLRRVAVGESTLYGGTPTDGPARPLRLPHGHRALRFDFAAPFLGEEAGTEYRTFLEGYEAEPAAWGPATYREYTNLAPGRYVLHVEARSGSGVTAAAATYAFTVAPPWWRTWWAYGLCGLAAVGLLGLAARVARRRAEQRERARAHEQELAHAREIERAYAQLQTTQRQLVQAEKLAGLGRLTAGIAHEIKNPLNFVNNFSSLSVDLVEELRQELEAARDRPVEEVLGGVDPLLDDLAANASRVREHGQRADAIVQGMMMHARGGTEARRPVDLNALVEDHVRLALEARQTKGPGAPVARDYAPDMGTVVVAPQAIGRAVVNLVANALDAVDERALDVAGGDGESGYAPWVVVRTRREDGQAVVEVEDNGVGIPQAVRARLFEPFTTTKPAGLGHVGLGLSLARDSVEGHGGTLTAESAEGAGATFTLTLPVSVDEPDLGQTVEALP